MKIKNNTGFTIIELLIATLVFSIILLVVAYSAISIGRIYYRGITDSKTQDIARNAIDDISKAIQFNGGDIKIATVTGGTSGFCVGGRLYSYKLFTEVSGTTHALVADTLGGGCSAAEDIGSTPPTTSSELLGERMRLTLLCISTPTHPCNDLNDNVGLYEVRVRVVYGDDDLLQDKLGADGNPGSDGVVDSCKDIRFGTEFCTASELKTIVQKRVQ
ncbi:MAG TPA: type II secretion system protein [Candidatus Saccharimonadales bacterium]|nr:type II secretion system protein [Candidatus Saccharimonadales bacterium]